MEKSTLKQYLSTAYDRDNWIEILEEVFKTGKVFQEPQEADLPKSDNCKEGFQLGTFETSDGRRISVFEIEVTDKTQLDRNRVSLRNLLRSYYSQVDGIFAVFKKDDNWRFSFISKVTDYDEDKEEFVEVETEPKRYTYVLGKGEAVKTATDRFNALVEANKVSFEDIKEAFSVEKLNKEFYKKVVSFFYDLIGVKEPGRGGEQHPHLLKLPSVSQTSEQGKKTHQEFAVRLIGRTVFCWFLRFKKSEQENPIIPKEVLSSDNIPENYYHKYLERLFFQVMNTKIGERRDDIPKVFESIPFLNGGLFEPHSNDYYALDEATGLSKNLNTLKIPDSWFKDFFTVLEQYNFTIDENSVEDADVSVDPEMLGRIFENLLAEIDPASGKTARKATGSYYTPREIVDYMVDESLTKYLSRKTGVNERRLLPLLKFDTEVKKDISEDEAIAIIEALNELKVLDPACGSGAFPMGILQKMVRILEKVDPKSERWKDLQLRKIPSAVVRRLLKKKLDDATVEYARKLGIIQHSIYGVDIQPIAAEISKLRCFLSLVVDEKVDEAEDNWAIDALPNLEFKFVTANSLISLPREDSKTIDLFGSSDLMDQLETIREDYLQAHSDEKEYLKEQFQKVQGAILKKELEGTGNNQSERAIMLSSWEPFSDSVTGWFDSKWMFGVEQFHVVIGNPPYGGDKISNDLKNELKLGSKDPYGAFIARFLADGKTLSPLRHKGILSFIVSDTFMTIGSHFELREMIMDNYIHKMIRVHPDTFKATVNTAIIVCERNEFPIEDKKPIPQFDESHTCLMGDLTRISIHEQHVRFIQLLERTVQYKHALPESVSESVKEEHGVLWMRGQNWCSESSNDYAFYAYHQNFIKINSSYPLFVCSPKLFRITSTEFKSIKEDELPDRFKNIEAHRVKINNKAIRVSRLGDDYKREGGEKIWHDEGLSKVISGIKTGSNSKYLRTLSGDKYDKVEVAKTVEISSAQQLSSIEFKDGLSGERTFLPFDMGKASNTVDGWLPNYFQPPTDFYINWSKDSVKDMYNESHSDLANSEFRGKKGVVFSKAGQYAPTFRITTGVIIDSGSNGIFSQNLNQKELLGSLANRFIRYIFNNIINHTVNAQVDDIKLIPISLELDFKAISTLTDKIIKKQENDLYYDYASHEQIEIDKLVYDAYGLNEYDIREVENWYARRYPRLLEAQKENLRNLGKSDDYLELYREVGEN